VIVAVWVNPNASNADEVYENNYHAAKGAVIAAMRYEPSLEVVREAAKNPHNPFFTLKS
jgi:5,6,7,8-tetrahydromethanopterin hydro-lyase